MRRAVITHIELKCQQITTETVAGTVAVLNACRLAGLFSTNKLTSCLAQRGLVAPNAVFVS